MPKSTWLPSHAPRRPLISTCQVSISASRKGKGVKDSSDSQTQPMVYIPLAKWNKATCDRTSLQGRLEYVVGMLMATCPVNWERRAERKMEDKECLCCSSSSHFISWCFFSLLKKQCFAQDYLPSCSDIVWFHYFLSFKISLTKLPINVSQAPLLRNNAPSYLFQMPKYHH